MGCKQTRTTPTSIVNTRSSVTPVHVKSVLKSSRAKNERPPITRQENQFGNKSVNFHEQVEVKLRTPTPNSRHDLQVSNPFRSHSSTNDADNDDSSSLGTSIPSPDEIHHPVLQRNHPNTFWHKNNSVTILPTDEYGLDHPDVYASQTSINAPGRTFRIRRRVQSVEPKPSETILPVASTHRPKVQSASFSVQRPLPNTNAVLVEHRTPMSSMDSAPQPAYYAFTRRPVDNTRSRRTKNSTIDEK
ncbi:unnamed protein product [Adineta ricciae]|uniref:Uncharacterized protein n=1 Tax=Adineta ricciae TaxID=249248 RepID=A0A814SF20_ADIRI|nr:unnamed protein product [Adineta ricciae]